MGGDCVPLAPVSFDVSRALHQQGALNILEKTWLKLLQQW